MSQSTMGTVDLGALMGDGGQGDRELKSRKSRVRCEDLNLSRKDDVKVLYQRIRAAAETDVPRLTEYHRQLTSHVLEGA